MILFFYPNVSSLSAPRPVVVSSRPLLASFASSRPSSRHRKIPTFVLPELLLSHRCLFLQSCLRRKTVPTIPTGEILRTACARGRRGPFRISPVPRHRASALHQDAFSKLVTRDDKRRQTGKETDIKLPRVDVRFRGGRRRRHPWGSLLRFATRVDGVVSRRAWTGR